MTVPSISSGPSTSVLIEGVTGANHNFKKIQVVPSSTEFLDIVLSKTQRKTPTVVHKGYQISRIRNFYMRKVKFTQSTFDEKLQQILIDFPKIEEVHPFYANLMNVLYDKDHYKLALGQLSTAKHLIDQIGKEYLKLLKFGDSLYRCKLLKRAALGRMATLMKRQKDALAYLEQVRQHLSRLPSIDPSTRTLLICGYPNVGKSSFMNKVSRAMVDVQQYAFTTKSLFVGHFDYNYLRWQVIDTPGILDHPLEERNTIEMQSITAMAHIRASVLFFIDASENCGYAIEQQLALFESLKPLFHNKCVVMVANKCDIIKLDALPSATRLLIEKAAQDASAHLLEASTMTEAGVMAVRNAACELLLASRVEQKRTTASSEGILSRLRVAVPVARDSISRPPIIPQPLEVKDDSLLLRDIELNNGGPGVFSYPQSLHHIIGDWKKCPIPEIMNGKNILDFVDPEIESRLAALEEEEEEEEARNEKDTTLKSSISRFKEVGKRRREATLKRSLTRIEARGRSIIPRPLRATEKKEIRVRSKSRFESHPLSERSRSRIGQRMLQGLGSEAKKEQSASLQQLSQRQRNRMGRAGDADRHETASLARHLFSGKRRMGTHDRR